MWTVKKEVENVEKKLNEKKAENLIGKRKNGKNKNYNKSERMKGVLSFTEKK